MDMEMDSNAEVVQAGPKTEEMAIMTSTPIQARHKRVRALKDEGGKTPLLKIPASPLLQMLGYGSGVGVFLMERSPKPSGELRSPWAIKKVQKLRATPRALFSERIEFEAEILRQLQHPNIIGYRGFKKSENGEVTLAMEKAPRSLGDIIVERMDNVSMICRTSGDMEDFLIDPFPPERIHKVSFDVAKALEYLHHEAKILHGDVKSANVLIFGDFEVAKLCDFGVSRKIKDDGVIEGIYAGTEMWMPMEAVLIKNGDTVQTITNKADIYPFGLTIYEMISLKPPHLPTVDGASFENSQSETEDSFYDRALTESLGKRPALPDMEFDDSYNLILALFYCCTDEDPAVRPDSKDIVKLLSAPLSDGKSAVKPSFPGNEKPHAEVDI